MKISAAVLEIEGIKVSSSQIKAGVLKWSSVQGGEELFLQESCYVIVGNQDRRSEGQVLGVGKDFVRA